MPDFSEPRSMIRAKHELAERFHQIRLTCFGDHGAAELAKRLGIPLRTWLNYEGGVSIPGEVLLVFLVLTDVEPLWLLKGEGAKFRVPASHP